jgi:predicted dehydrogenase
MKQVKLGVIGCGGMARHHMGYFGDIPGLKFAAAADAVPESVQAVVKQHGVEGFDDGQKMIESGVCDAVFICTPHWFHAPLSLAAFKQGLHVLTEKPVAVTAKDAAAVADAHKKKKGLVYAAMFQMRNAPLWKRVKHIIDTGGLGDVTRLVWIVTNWFRTQAYYDAGAWRATWKGEGGGVLLNQCPHNLDLICWLVGVPNLVHSHLSLGKYHRIEVEDDVTAYMQWKNGATGVFITTTGSSPGTDRLEITGDRGKLVVEGGKINHVQTHESVSGFCKTSEEAFGTPGADTISIDVGGKDPGHKAVTANFIAAIQDPKTPLICPGEDGIHELELGNAMLMSGLKEEPIKIPTDRNAFDKMLKDLIANSTFKKGAVKKAKVDMASSFH